MSSTKLPRIVRAMAVALALAALGLASCGGGSESRSGDRAAPASTGATSPGAGATRARGGTPSGAPDPTPPREVVDGSTSTTVARPDDAGPSPVAGLDAAEFRDVVTAPVPPPATRRRPGPTADRVGLADGRVVWRVRIPGRFPTRSARASITVAGRDLGPAASPPSLDALVAVTLDGEVLHDGAPVTYRWGRGEPIEAGSLVVIP